MQSQSKTVSVPGGITAPRGFRAAAVHAGIRRTRDDLALVVSDRPAGAAGVFTTNRVQAAPVVLDREIVAGGTARAVIFNSGNANACTGERGMRDARAMRRTTAECLGIPENEVLVCSTGVIGVPLPMDKILPGIRAAAGALSPDGGDAAARAIMTTDRTDKQAAAAFDAEDGGGTVTLGAMAKGAGMIDPRMATMLAMVTTDAAIAPGLLREVLRGAVDRSFNRITVDGDRSTNDTVLLLANGASGVSLDEAHDAWPVFEKTLADLCLELARMMVRDGEGATRLVTVRVRGAASDADADLAARAVARSSLVKTSWFGRDPNWGRVIAALGYSGAAMDEARTRIFYGGVPAFDRGRPAGEADRNALRMVMGEPEFEVVIDLGLGRGASTIYTCDLTVDYVTLNADYTT